MTIQSLPQDPTEIIASVESFFDALPAKRQRRTTAKVRALVDDTPETENYGVDPAHTSINCELDHDAQVSMFLLMRELSRTTNDGDAQVVIAKICALVGLSCELPSYGEALTRIYRKVTK